MHRPPGPGRADVVAEHLLGRLGIDPVAPVDLEAIAAGLGVDGVRAADLVEDGRVERRAGRVEIVVRQGAPPARRRFTIAHELAHVVLGPEAGERSPRDERRCDEIAAALLLPRAWVEAVYADRPRSLATVRSLAHEAGVSVSAAVTRLDEVLRWRRALLRFRRREGRWRFLGACAVPPSAAAGLRSAPATSESLDAIAGRSTRDMQAPVPIRLYDAVVEIDAEVSVRAGSALVLADAAAFSRRQGSTRAPLWPSPAAPRSPHTSGE